MIQTDQQMMEGLWIMGILIVAILFLGVWANNEQSKEKAMLKKKLADGKVAQYDLDTARKNEYYEIANNIREFLINQEQEKLKNEAKDVDNNVVFKKADKEVIEVINILQDNTHKCNKCGNSYMRVWKLNIDSFELKCDGCRKNFTYNQSFYKNINLQKFLGNINTLKKRHDLQIRNHHVKMGEFRFDYNGHRTNSPNTYPITLNSALEPKKTSIEVKVEILNGDKRSRRIKQEVKDKVWNRDGGRCVECGNNQNLEFDHIIPFSKGGANTYRNLQLLCQECNRKKSDKIG